jgi:hypothetical protein
LPAALEFYVAIHIYKGAFSAAESLLAEEDALAQATGIIAGSDVALLLAAWKEPPPQALHRIRTALDDAKARGEESSITYGEYVAAFSTTGLVDRTSLSPPSSGRIDTTRRAVTTSRSRN